VTGPPAAPQVKTPAGIGLRDIVAQPLHSRDLIAHFEIAQIAIDRRFESQPAA
jgi:hypothetical protein